MLTTMDEHKRLFVATFFEQPQTENLLKMQNALASLSSCGRCTNVKKLHLTWLFLGDTPASSIDEILCGLNIAAKQQQMETSFCGMDLFHKGTAAVLLRLSKQMAQAQQAITQACPNTAPKKFKPHATLMRDARFDLPFDEVKKSVMIFNRPFTLTNFCLVESDPQNSYAYHIVEKFAFDK